MKSVSCCNTNLSFSSKKTLLAIIWD